MLTFNASREEYKLLAKLASRAVRAGLDGSYEQIEMDLTACHCNGARLDLMALLGASPFNFAHDVLGIRQHLDRETGELCDSFWPRYAAR